MRGIAYGTGRGTNVVEECLKPESNRRPSHYECAALPTELFRREDGEILSDGELRG